MLFSWPLTALSRGFTPIFLLPGQIIRASQGVNGKRAPPDRRLNLLGTIRKYPGSGTAGRPSSILRLGFTKTDGSQGAIAFHQFTEIKRYFDRRY
ncbi:hypothetical protein [Rhizobium leguminosarum]|uniref:hypothetical protein n=1 Tax=Rhizobium leguminosarum TaxID=384 RepID=UPI001C983FBC|nr:hypothetical protein [Rhizobium leguminosarum]MBY5808798.1 hypothetical protein [Rhizobium leguminosarum]